MKKDPSEEGYRRKLKKIEYVTISPSQVREAELLVSTLVEEGERRATEADRLQQELIRARIAEKQAKEKLSSFVHSFNHSASTSSTLLNTPLFTASLLNATSTPHLPVTSLSHRYSCGRFSYFIYGKHLMAEFSSSKG